MKLRIDSTHICKEHFSIALTININSRKIRDGKIVKQVEKVYVACRTNFTIY